METDKEKLTLKEVAGYLPYGLILQYIDTLTLRKRKAFLTSLGINEIETTYKRKVNGCSGDLISWTGNNNVSIMKVKPILRPLSDLTKDEYFDLYLELCEELGVVRCEHLLLALQDKSYFAFPIQKLEALEEFMYKNHFDWKYNLIKRNLAINLNDLPNE